MLSKLNLVFALSILLISFMANCNRVKRDDLHHPEDVKKHQKHWGYRNQDKSILPKDWYKHHPQCYGQQQSPINIEFAATEYDESLDEIKIKKSSIAQNDNDPKELWEVKNNGHSVVFTPKNKKFSFTLNPENEEFNLLQMHFHWRGSEHYVNGKKFAAELHLVHQSKNNTNRFAVIGFLFSLVHDDNPHMEPIVEELGDVVNYNTLSKTSDLELNKLIWFNLNKYYRYSGSLTTPSCDEIVEWIVVDGPVLGLSEEQLLSFQSIQDQSGYPILTNSRPIQGLNDRAVRRSFHKEKTLRLKDTLVSASGYNNAFSFKKQNFFFLFSSIILALIY